MRLYQKCKIEKVCSKDKHREVLQNPFLELDPKKRLTQESGGDGGELVATNGRFLVAIPVSVSEEDTAGVVPVGAILAARKTEDNELVCAEDRVESLEAGVSYSRTDISFPALTEIVPQPDAEANTIRLNAKFLYELAQGLGSDEIELKVSKTNSERAPIVVHTLNELDSAIGILMPVIKDNQ